MVWILANWKKVIIGLALAMAFAAGWRICAWRYDSAIVGELKRQVAEYEQLDKQRLADATELERKLEEARKNAEIRYIERKKIVERPVYRECRIDTDGLRILHERQSEINTARKYAYPSRGNTAPSR